MRRAVPPALVLATALVATLASPAGAVVPSGPPSGGADLGPLSPLGQAELFPGSSPAPSEPRSRSDDRAGIIPGHYIVVFKDSVKRPANVARAQTKQQNGKLGFVYPRLNGYSAKSLSRGDVKALRNDPRVKYVSPDREVVAAAQQIPTGIERIYATQSKLADIDEEDDVRVDANVAVIDSGIDYDHPDLNVVGRTNCVPVGEKTSEEFEECADGAGDDLNGHGTHVAGTIGALDNEKGVVGVAPGARLWAVRALNKGGRGSFAWLIGAVEWVTATREDEDPENDIEAANMSIGCGVLPCVVPAFDKVLSKSAEAGVVYAVAAGNESGDASESTFGTNPHVITVSALADYDGKPGDESAPTCHDYGFDDTLASFSNYGEDVEVAAPGVCIRSTWKNGGYVRISGTSMASPHVAGAAALRASEDPPEDLEDVEAIREAIESDGNQEWIDTSHDGTQEPLLDVGRAVTEPATIDSESEVTLHGRVRPGGVETSYRFEYGEEAGEYETSVPIPDEGVEPGSGYVEVSEPIGGLEGHATYHYRIVTTYAEEETVYGPDRAFGTTPPAATTEEASEVHANDATLNATVNPEGLATGYYFEYGPTTDYGRRVPVSAPWENIGSGSEDVAVDVLAGVLNASTTYHYRVVARNAAGLVYGEDETFETSPAQWPGERVEQPNPNPNPSPNAGENSRNRLERISCSAQDSCMAVGNFTNFLQQSESMRWDGQEWTAFPMAPREEGLSTVNTDVSCPTENRCVAVGWGSAEPPPAEGFEGTPIVEHWDGDKWTLGEVPLPDEAVVPALNAAPLSGVSCASANFCMAVGSYYEDVDTKERRPMSFRWDGVEWSLVEMPVPPNSGDFASAYEVDCPSTSWCMAVGAHEEDEEFRQPFAEVWDGEEWTVVQSAGPGEPAFHRYLLDVSCAVADDCIARFEESGTASPSSRVKVERWDGEGWSEEALPEAVDAERTRIGNVECSSVDACTAVGFAYWNPDEWAPVAYAWDGSTWSAQSISVATLEESGIPNAEFWGVSCASPSACVAVGGDIPEELGERSGIAAFYRAPGPGAATDPATAVGWTNATLNTTVNPEGLETSYQFEYGTSKKYGSSAPASAEGISAGSEDVALSKAIGGLEPATTYHFRVKATNSEGTTYGEDRTFRTPPIAPPHFSSSFGQAGSEEGQLDEPYGIAVSAEGDIWVADSENSRIEKFAPDGELLLQVGEEGSGEGQFAEPYGIAVGPEGNVWVADSFNSRLVELDSEGEFVKTIGWGVADGESEEFQSCESGCHAGIAGTGAGQLHHPYGITFDAEGNIWVVNTAGHRVEELDAEGEYVSQFAVSGENTDIAIDAEGDVWLVDYNDHVKQLSPEGELLLEFGAEGSGNGQFDFPTGIGLGPAGNVWVADSENDRVQVFDPEGEYLTQFGEAGSAEGQMEFPGDVAFDPNGGIWVADSENSRVQEWTYALVARTEAASAVKLEEATLNATIGPSGIETKYHFEYDTSEYKQGEGPHGTKAPVPSKAIGAGTEDVEVSQTLGGLDGNTVYHFRVVATDKETTVYGEDRQFTTTGPQAITEAATAVSAGGAVLHGSVNPNGLETEYHFEYDTSEYKKGEGAHGTKAPVPDEAVGSGSEAVEVEEAIEGLKPETSYHFRLVATNADGTVYGGDETFSTFGAGWSLQETDLPSESAYVLLRDVSCASSSECIAVGLSTDAGGATSQRWNGSEWNTLSNAEGTTLLTDVSCTSASFCLAMPAGQTAAQRWDGEEWELASMVEPAEAENFQPRNISCASQSACIAVGTYKASGQWQALSESWDGSEWSLLSTPAGEAGGNDDLNAVSCTAADSCTAIGRKDGESSPSQGEPLALRWDGSEWSALADPESAAGENSDISCTAPSACTAVFNTAQAERWDGSEWSATALPAPEGGSSPTLRGVSCAGQDACIAVGSYILSEDTVTLAENWDGSTWKAQRPPNPEGVSDPMGLEGVSCSSADRCTAVGYHSPGEFFGVQSFAERYAPLPRPTATTEAATEVGANAATLNATVNPEGLETTYQFEYVDQATCQEDVEAKGEGHCFDDATAAPSSPKGIGSGTSDIGVKETVSGLVPETTYHFRVKATNSADTAYGDDETLTTTEPAGPALEPPGGEFPASFSLAGEQEVSLRGPSPIDCSGEGEAQPLGGEGQFEDADSGTATLTLRNCETEGYECHTSGEAAGTIKAEDLRFRLVYLSDGKPGVLFLPNAESERFATAQCVFELLPVEIAGNGVLGRISDPAPREPSPTLTIDLDAPEAGEGEYAQEYTETQAGAEYGLLEGVGGEEAEPAALEAEATASFSEGEAVLVEAHPYLEPPGGEFPASFSLAGEQEVSLRGPGPIDCSGEGEAQPLGGEGQFEDASSGTATLILRNCETEGFECHTAGEEAGTIKAEGLRFRLVYLSDGEPGVLFLPNAESGQFATAKCVFELVPVEIAGNGVLGRISEPALGEPSPTLTIDLDAPEAGEGEYAQEYTETEAGAEYGLLEGVGGEEAEPAALEAEATASFSEGEGELTEE